MQTFNYHTHTARCNHAQVVPDHDFAQALYDAGFRHIAFTDHVPQPESFNPLPESRMKTEETDAYLESINQLKKEFEGRMIIEAGFEIEYDPQLESYYRALRERCDLFILGQHYVIDDDGSYVVPRNRLFTDQELEKYVDLVEQAAASGLIRLIAHPDTFMLGRTSFGEAEAAAARRICEISLRYDIPLEINLCQPYWNRVKGKTIHYPVAGFWQIAAQYPVKVLWGVDMHYIEQAGMAKDVIEFTTNLLGKDTIDQLQFVDENLQPVSNS